MNFKFITSLMSVCLALLLTSCSSNDDDSNYQHYDKDSNNVVYNGGAAYSSLASFTIETNDGKTTLIANNAVLGNPKLIFEDIKLEENNGKTTFKVNDSNNDRNITFNGKIENEKLTIEGDVEFKSEIIGKWGMPLDIPFLNSTMGIVDWSATIKDGLTDKDNGKAYTTSGMLELLGNMIGQSIASEIDQLTIEFKKNGIIASHYRTVIDNEEHEGLPLGLTLNYFIRDNKLYVAMPADLLKAIPTELKNNEVIKTALILIKEEGGYAYTELKIAEGEIHKDEINSKYKLFYVDDAIFSVLNPVIVDYIENNIDSLPLPDEISFMGMQLDKENAKIVISNIVSGLPYLENYKFGLGFTKL